MLGPPLKCAECGSPNADRSPSEVDKRLATDLRYCRDCYERLANRIMRPARTALDDLEMLEQ